MGCTPSIHVNQTGVVYCRDSEASNSPLASHSATVIAGKTVVRAETTDHSHSSSSGRAKIKESSPLLEVVACRKPRDMNVSYLFLLRWDRLFEINNVVSQRFVKILNINITNKLLFLLENVRLFCIAKDSHIFSNKNNSVFAYVVGKCLTS